MRGVVPCEMTSSCVQGGIPRPVVGYQPNVRIGPSSPASAWQFQPAVPKQEPVDHEDRNDSGINSGSDFHSSSPGSDHSENIPYSSPSNSQTTRPNPQTGYYSTPLAIAGTLANMTYHQQQVLNNQNILTPPMSTSTQNTIPNEKSEPMEIEQQVLALSKATGASMLQVKKPEEVNNCLTQLQRVLEKTCVVSTPPSSKVSECSDETKSENDVEDYDDREVRTPRVNSHGKIKTFKCKQCDFVAITKEDFWKHTRSHIKPDKLLTCPQCSFITEYKHHLEYHLRNHYGSKPFKCTYCKYSCVNKSMLNSHLKSHSSVYQYRCSDCAYVTKYCHSLKLHLRKYGHKPAMVLNPDGTPNPLPVIDVYGTRRGPKLKIQESKQQEEPKQEQILPFNLNQLMYNTQLPIGFPNFPYFPAIPNPLLLRSLENFVNAQASLLSPPEQPQEESSSSSVPEMEVLDLSKPDESEQKSRRKGRAFKLTPTRDVSTDDEEETTMFSNVEVVEDKPQAKEEAEEVKPEGCAANNNNNHQKDFACQYCDINFGDPVLYTMHMGYHGYKNPFTCNMCGEECNDKVAFFLHIARTSHS